MNETVSTGLAHCSLMVLLAAGVAIFALLDDGEAHAGKGGSLTYLTQTATK